MQGKWLVANVAAGLGGLILAGAASGATIQVTTQVDEFGTGANCSLREAVYTANGNTPYGGCELAGGGSADVVSVRGGKTYALTIMGSEDGNTAGDLDVLDTLKVETRGTGKAPIDASGLDRVLDVRPNSQLTATGLIVTGGVLPVGGRGGGIFNHGRLVLRRSVVTENTIGAGGIGAGIETEGSAAVLDRVKVTKNTTFTSSASGGGIASIQGKLVVRRSTIAGNGADGGGGIYLTSEQPTRIDASTIGGNSAETEQFSGGGIYAYDGVGPPSEILLTNVTISGNHADGRGGGILSGGTAVVDANAVTITNNVADFDTDSAGTISGSGGGVDGSVAFKNSIVAGNFATNAGSEDCSSASGGNHNVVGRNAGCANPGVGTTNPRLGPLRENGGPTKTHALKRGSPAIGKAGGSTPPRDQRGVKRDADPDAGAYER